MRKRSKKCSILLLAAVFLLTGCAPGRGEPVSVIEPGQSDLEYIQSKETLIVGVTDFAPMDYRSRESWTGFDADLAKAFAESIGVALELREINWDKKTELLEKGSIDCIWNGMTMSEELKESISCSEPYLSNAQVVVLRSSEKEQYSTIEACQHMLFAVEAGSMGEALLERRKYRYSVCPTQMDALKAVQAKRADAAVIDLIMAAYYTGEGQAFKGLKIDIYLNDETICVGLRKDSDLTEKVNEFLRNAYEDGTINALAERYGIENAVLKTGSVKNG
ncbi:MAG: transporter substrate-binding domain-containing protein [Bacillota bacterium]|nr:transporter substrate-binding domain-containing protein [Bacillota bacterium]